MVRDSAAFDTLTNCALWHSDLRNSIICPFCGRGLFSSLLLILRFSPCALRSFFASLFSSSYFLFFFFFVYSSSPIGDSVVFSVRRYPIRSSASIRLLSRLIYIPYRYKYFALFRPARLIWNDIFHVSDAQIF